MIVQMKHLDLVCAASARLQTLERLRSFGAVHLNLSSANAPSVSAAQGALADAEKAVRIILKARGKREDLPIRARSVEEVLHLDEDRQTLIAEQERLGREIRALEPYGDFDVALAKKLQGEVSGLSDFVELPAPLPEMRLSRLVEKSARIANRIRIDNEKLASCDEKAILASHPVLKDRVEFEQAKELLADHGAVSVISGWIPVTRVKELMDIVTSARFDLFERVNAIGWGVLLRDPEPGELPPTLIEPPRFFRAARTLFEGLGIAPAYTEGDVSVPFLCYFSVFFAMLVGDGAYGAIMLAATLLMRKRLPRAWFAMLSVFSSATVLWGVLSNTWFGAGIPWCASWPTVCWLADPSYRNMMLLCFTIGVSHLMLARIWNGVCRFPDSTSLAEFGWAGILLFMYFVTNSIVGVFGGVPTLMFWVFGLSLALVFLFTVKPSELKARGAELGMLPLNVMSALGDIISYVRLFAVGLASVKVAENFNSMAMGLFSESNSFLANALVAVAAAAILIIGHALNLAMAGLSVLVHAVRLNTLEFSNHKGVSWAGYAFRAFGASRRKE